MERDVAVRIENHESQAWAACVEATGAVGGNPLGAEVDRSGPVPLPVLRSVNYGLFNRVIGFGVVHPADEAEVGRIRHWYAELSQTDYVLELSPVARPEGAEELLAAQGLVASATRQAKVWRTPGEVTVVGGLLVRELTTEDRDAFAAVNVAAWGVPPVMSAWLGATLGSSGFRHFGVVDHDEVVSVGAMYVSDDLAWLGFGATLPSHRGGACSPPRSRDGSARQPRWGATSSTQRRPARRRTRRSHAGRGLRARLRQGLLRSVGAGGVRAPASRGGPTRVRGRAG